MSNVLVTDHETNKAVLDRVRDGETFREAYERIVRDEGMSAGDSTYCEVSEMLIKS
jgi:endonuclease YncB( thermonuclease family)